ncbi:MAG: L-2-amino-thiazoline-4-carboxylic acid hydrolase [Bacillota bacterium]
MRKGTAVGKRAAAKKTAAKKTAPKGTISRREAARGVAITAERLALLHLCYAQTLVEELGEARGKELAAKAIKRYGTEIGGAVRKAVTEAGLPLDPANYGKGKAQDLPGFGMHDRIEASEVAGEPRLRAHGCVMGQFWHEKGQDELGRIYCYVDPAKYMAYNPDHKMVHLKCVPDGDAFCEFTIKATTPEDRKRFKRGGPDWIAVDKP